MAGIRHVWTRPEQVRTELPGLILGWQQRSDGWQALVTYVMPQGRVVTEWLPREQLRPAAAPPYHGSAYG